MGKLFKIGCSTILILVVVVVTIFIVAVKNDDNNVSNKNSSTKSSSSKSKYETSKELTTFEGVKVSFIALDDPEVGITMLTLDLKIENNSGETVNVILTDGYINDTKIQFLGALELETGKNGRGVYSFGYGGLGISGKEDIKKIEFKLQIYGETFDFKTSNKITLNFK